jgi:hypothetical protein
VYTPTFLTKHSTAFVVSFCYCPWKVNCSPDAKIASILRTLILKRLSDDTQLTGEKRAEVYKLRNSGLLHWDHSACQTSGRSQKTTPLAPHEIGIAHNGTTCAVPFKYTSALQRVCKKAFGMDVHVSLFAPIKRRRHHANSSARPRRPPRNAAL